MSVKYIIQSPDDFFRAQEERLGDIDACRRWVDAPRDRDEHLERGHKSCAVCGTKSIRKIPMSDDNYYCRDKRCQAVRTTTAYRRQAALR